MPVARRRPVEDDEEGTTITRTKVRDDDEEDDEATPVPSPRRTRNVQPEPEQDDAGEDEDEDEEPAHPVIGSGWSDGKKQKESGGDYAKDFKFTEYEQLVKFLADAPYAVFQQHWIERAGKRSFICIGTGCPLCKVGNPARKQWNFNIAVVELDDKGRVIVEQKSLSTGTRLFSTLEQKNNDPKRGPLTKGYWALSKSGTKTSTVHSVTPVNARDLPEDPWEIDEAAVKPLVAKLTPYDSSILRVPTKAELRLIADEIED